MRRQRDSAIDAAHPAGEVRRDRAQLKRDLKAGRIAPEQVLTELPACVETMSVFDLLLAVPRFGRVRANKLLARARIAPSETVGSLSSGQRAELIAAFNPPAESARPVSAPPVSPHAAADVFLDELKRLIGEREPKLETLRRAARIVAAEESWRESLGLLLTEQDAAELLHVGTRELAELRTGGKVIALASRDGATRYPAFQFQDGRPSLDLAEAHRLLVEHGHISPWSAASWARTGHPELGGCSPAQWAGERREGRQLLIAAEHDASRLGQ